jgi:hypothetical protein
MPRDITPFANVIEEKEAVGDVPTTRPFADALQGEEKERI